MRLSILIVICALALPFMAFSQGEEKQQPQQGQEQTKEAAPETKATAPTKETHPADARTAPATRSGTKTDVQENRAEDANRRDTRKDAAAGARSETDTNARGENRTQTKKTNVQEFKSRHSELFSLGEHPKEYYVHRFGENHFRVIGNTYFVYEDGCWISVHVNGFGYSERVICSGDPDFIEVY